MEYLAVFPICDPATVDPKSMVEKNCGEMREAMDEALV
jgi:hypothetical protein